MSPMSWAKASALILLAGCGGGEKAKTADTTAMAAPPATPPAAAPESTPAAPAKPKPAEKKSGAAAGPTSPQLVALGDSIFHGQVAGGTCTACHGPDAKGTAVAPDLTDQKWLNGDGSYDFIVHTVTNGVPKPKEHPAPMPPKGGAMLSDQQVRAVAAYVYSLSHKS
jgi:mono/diheme cytochrome c family protein